MSQALNNPVQRARRETSSADIALPQKPDIVLTDDGSIQHADPIEAIGADALLGSYPETLAFNEEPVTIMIHPSREKNPPLVVDCWVNGKGAEVFVRGRWHQFNCLPINKQVTTKRKYVEALAMSRTDTINTVVEDELSEHPNNVTRRTSSANAPFSVIRDDNPKGAEWLRRIMSQPL